jgi:hypothetical protein
MLKIGSNDWLDLRVLLIFVPLYTSLEVIMNQKVDIKLCYELIGGQNTSMKSDRKHTLRQKNN